MTGNLDTVSVADIIEAEGRRAPSHEQAQRHFRMATIVVSPKLLSPVEMTWFDRQAVFVGEADFYASRGAHPLIFESTHFLRRANFDNIESSGWANILNAVGWILITVFVISLGRTWIR